MTTQTTKTVIPIEDVRGWCGQDVLDPSGEKLGGLAMSYSPRLDLNRRPDVAPWERCLQQPTQPMWQTRADAPPDATHRRRDTP